MQLGTTVHLMPRRNPDEDKSLTWAFARRLVQDSFNARSMLEMLRPGDT